MAAKRDLMVVAGGRLATALMTLISIRAITTFLTPEQYGEFALLISIQMFCGLFLINPVGQHINLHTHEWWDNGTLFARLRSYRSYILSVSVVGTIVVFVVAQGDANLHLVWAALAMFIMVVAGTWNATLVPLLNMLGFRAASILWSLITVAAGLCCSIILVLWSPSAEMWLLGQATGMAIGVWGARIAIRQHNTHSASGEKTLPLLERKTIINYCIPLALATGLMWLQLSGYRFAIKNYWGLAQLGYLAVGLQLAGQIWGLAESLATQFLYPLFYRRVSNHEQLPEVNLAFSDLLNTLLPVYFILAGLTVLSAPYLLKLLVATQFQDALNFVMLGAGIELCRVLGNLFSNAAHVKRKTKSLTLPYAIGSLTALGLIYFMGSRQAGIGWAGVALIAGSFAMLLTMVASMYRQIKFSLDILRCGSGALVMLMMAAFISWMPSVSSSVGAAVILILVSLFSALMGLVFLWKNPATHRLLNVQLRKN